MKAISLIIAMLISTPAVAKPCKHDPQNSKFILSAIYTAQMATRAEKKKFGESFKEIGFDPSSAAFCDSSNWNIELMTDQDGQGFHAYADSNVTGETWIIDDKKTIEQL